MKTAMQNPEPRVLIPEADLDRRISEMAKEIERDYADSDRLVAVGVLKGSVFFMVDLLKRLNGEVTEEGATKGLARIESDIDATEEQLKAYQKFAIILP